MGCAHKTIVLVGLIAPLFSPLVTILVSMESGDESLGYGVVIYPPYQCQVSNKKVVFYADIQPLNIMASLGLTFLILIFWKIYKVRLISILYLTLHGR